MYFLGNAQLNLIDLGVGDRALLGMHTRAVVIVTCLCKKHIWSIASYIGNSCMCCCGDNLLVQKTRPVNNDQLRYTQNQIQVQSRKRQNYMNRNVRTHTSKS